MRNIFALPAILLIRLYQHTLSLMLGNCCRFKPSCSEYAIEAYQVHGLVYGSWLTFKRIMRCNPWGGHGYDPVPPRKKKERKHVPTV